MPKLWSGFPAWQGLEATSPRNLASVKSLTFSYQGLYLGQKFLQKCQPSITVLALISLFIPYTRGFFPCLSCQNFIKFYFYLFIQPFYESVLPYCQNQRLLWNTEVHTQHKLEICFNAVVLLPLQSQWENLAHKLRPKCSKSEGPGWIPNQVWVTSDASLVLFKVIGTMRQGGNEIFIAHSILPNLYVQVLTKEKPLPSTLWVIVN